MSTDLGRPVPPHASGGGMGECPYCYLQRRRRRDPLVTVTPRGAAARGVPRWEVIDGHGRETGTYLFGVADRCMCGEYGYLSRQQEREQ